MTHKELAQLAYLKGEIAVLEKEERNLRRSLRKMESHQFDTVTGSNPQFPYNPQSFYVGGVQVHMANRAQYVATHGQLKDIQANITAKKDACLREYAKLTRFINGIEDSLTRQVFRYRYAQGMTWEQVADKVGGGNTADSVRMLCARCLRVK